MNGSRWNLKALGEYAPYFLVFKNAVEKVVREYAESLTEHLPIDKESGQPDFEALKIQCKNLKIAKDKAAELLDWYYSCYITIANGIDDIPIIPTEHPDAVNVQPLYSCPNEKPEIKELKDDIQSEEVKDERTDEAGEETV